MIRIFLLSLVFVCSVASAQQKNIPVVDTPDSHSDTTEIAELKDLAADNIAQVSIDESDANGASQASGLLNTRDPFYSASTFNFSAARFRFRGYSSDFGTTYMNGLTMETLENGFTPFGQWGGLNYILTNRKISLGLAPNSFGYGNIGTTTAIDTRASKQWKQTQVGYGFSTGNYTNRVSFSHSTGLGKTGWAFTFAGTFRGADEGYVKGTYSNNYSYFVGMDKKIGQKHLLSLVGFGAPSENGRAGSSVREMLDISKDNYYNPNWGYQNGKKRNAVVAKTNQPVFILTHEYKVDKNSNITTAVGYTFGERSQSTLDWYNSSDPRPDYYRYLPSYQTDDPNLQNQIREALSADENKRQIDWAGLYNANRNHYEVFHNANGIQGNDFAGLRSSYLVAKNVTNTRRGSVRTVFNQKMNKNLDFTFGLSHQVEKNSYYRQIADLLGGTYFVDVNQFAERDFASNPNAGQNDLNRPNRILKVGDRYSYDYDMIINKSSAFSQGVAKFKKFDFFAAAEISNTSFWRNGNAKNGLFPENSYGESTEYSFNNYSVKGGINFKPGSRNYFYLNAMQMTRAPFYRNVYLSARTRDFVQDNLKNERIQSIEGGYVATTPVIKFRLSGYYTRTKNQLNIITFYNDLYRNFVNYSLSKMGRLDFGSELGVESRAVRNLIISGAASVGRHYFDGRPEVTVTQDNSSQIVDKTTIYSQNYRGSSPQESYSFGLLYRSPNYWSIGGNVNYFDQMWLDFNPIRRTVGIVQAIPYKSTQWNEVVDQQRLSGQTTVNMFAFYSWKLPSSLSFKRKTFLFLNFNVNNLLDNKNFVTGGREQLRYDNVDNNVDKFPARYFYSYGRTFSVSAKFRF